jgi:hypothetical protein
MESLGSRSAIAPAVVKTAAQKKYPKPRPRVLARARSDANDDASEAKKQAVAGAQDSSQQDYLSVRRRRRIADARAPVRAFPQRGFVASMRGRRLRPTPRVGARPNAESTRPRVVARWDRSSRPAQTLNAR